MTSLQMLVSTHQAKAHQNSSQIVDWSKRKEKWLKALHDLNAHIQQEMEKAGVPSSQIKVTDHPIHEETLGSYHAHGLQVNIGTSEIKFIPIGSVIIGGYGRVDVQGPLGELKLIADDANEQLGRQDATPSYERDWRWFAYPERSPRNSYPLDDLGLTKVVETVLGRV